ncbi:unnamed protein product [Calypogeia fissa]
MMKRGAWVALLGIAVAAVLVVSVVSSNSGAAKTEDPNVNVSYSSSGGSYDVDGKLRRRPVKEGAEYNQQFVEHTNWLNAIVLGAFMSPSTRAKYPHFLVSWLRNYVAGNVVYFLSGGLWCLWVYWWKKDQYFPKGNIPTKEPILLQIMVSMKGMPLYTVLPTAAEWMVEKGWTRCYSNIEEAGFAGYMMSNLAYMAFNEFWIYWMHRLLHDIKPLYKLLHATHHIYNKENTLSPFAGLAFNPIDGIIQACPHVFALFFVPMHFFTHEVLLFCEAIWTTNIHDCIHGDVFGIMGAGYHTIHHTTYRHNYGHYTIFMDWLLGTLREPVPETTNEKVLKSLKEKDLKSS